jgi:CBS domain-containing protein
LHDNRGNLSKDEEGLIMKAKDLMVPLSDYLSPDSTVEEAVRLLISAKRGERRTGVKGLPVLNASGKAVGMLTMRDILRAVLPSYMSLMNLGDFTWDGMLEEMARRVSGKKIGEIMNPEVTSVGEDAPLMECVDHMIKGNFKRLPVVDAAGKVVGMLYERDIFLTITKAMHTGQTDGHE